MRWVLIVLGIIVLFIVVTNGKAVGSMAKSLTSVLVAITNGLKFKQQP